MHWPGVSNIQDGVTVDLGHMNGIQVHTQGEDKVAKLGPGARWGYVYRALQILNLVFLEVLWIGLALATFYFEPGRGRDCLVFDGRMLAVVQAECHSSLLKWALYVTIFSSVRSFSEILRFRRQLLRSIQIYGMY